MKTHQRQIGKLTNLQMAVLFVQLNDYSWFSLIDLSIIIYALILLVVILDFYYYSKLTIKLKEKEIVLLSAQFFKELMPDDKEISYKIIKIQKEIDTLKQKIENYKGLGKIIANL